MECPDCGSEKGFRGVGKPERVFCKKCGAEVPLPIARVSLPCEHGRDGLMCPHCLGTNVEPDKVLVGVPSHLQDSFDGAQLVYSEDFEKA